MARRVCIPSPTYRLALASEDRVPEVGERNELEAAAPWPGYGLSKTGKIKRGYLQHGDGRAHHLLKSTLLQKAHSLHPILTRAADQHGRR